MHHDNLEITVNLEELISHLKINKENHINDFKKAKKIYLNRIGDFLTESNKLLMDETLPKNNYKHNLHQPIDMSKEYDKFIGMLEMAQEKELKISSYQYDCFVNDEWDWISQSKTINAMYLND